MWQRKTNALLTDLYQLTMAAGYLRCGMAERQAVFHLFFRRNPFGGGFSVASGLEQVIELLEDFNVASEDLTYLASLTGNDGAPLFDDAFLAYLGDLRLTCDIDAIPEGTVVFPHEPLLRIRGPILQCQILETPLLTLLNFPTLIATKAARVCLAAAGDPVLEFGLRRAQGPDGGLTASRAAYVGGCVGTSNVLAGQRFGIPVKGTHAHSWVMAFDSEAAAFAAYAEAMPNNCIFLVDTYDTLGGVRQAIEVGKELRRRGHEMIGIRLDSGDLVILSRAARCLLDEAGFPDAAIVASNDLDEHAIQRLKAAGAKIDLWGVGTRLATAHDQPSLGGVYKLAAIEDGDGWRAVIKLSEDAAKSSIAGVQQVRRFSTAEGLFLGDVIYDAFRGLLQPPTQVSVNGHRSPLPEDATGEDLLVPVARKGRTVYDTPQLSAVRERALAQIARLPVAVRELEQPTTYPVGFDPQLFALQEDLAAEQRMRNPK